MKVVLPCSKSVEPCCISKTRMYDCFVALSWLFSLWHASMHFPLPVADGEVYCVAEFYVLDGLWVFDGDAYVIFFFLFVL